MKILPLLTASVLLATFGTAEMKSTLETTIHATGEHNYVLGVTITPAEDWHTYWSNPGEAGMSLRLKWADAAVEQRVQQVSFPVPKRYVLGGIVTYGYSGPATTLYSLKGGEAGEVIKGEAHWLTCDETTCLPGEGEVQLTLPQYDSLALKPAWLVQAEKALPAQVTSAQAVYKQGAEEGLWVFSLPNTAEFAPYQDGVVYSESEVFSERDGPTHLQASEGTLSCLLRGPKQEHEGPVTLLLKPKEEGSKKVLKKAVLVTFSPAEAAPDSPSSTPAESQE